MFGIHRRKVEASLLFQSDHGVRAYGNFGRMRLDLAKDEEDAVYNLTSLNLKYICTLPY